MLNCKISKKFTTSCETNVAGIDKIAVANWNPNYVFTSSNSGCSIDSIDLKDEKVYDMPFMDGTGYFNITGTIGANRDSKYYLHTVGFVLPNLSCENLEDLTNYFLAKVIAFFAQRMERFMLSELIVVFPLQRLILHQEQQKVTKAV